MLFLVTLATQSSPAVARLKQLSIEQGVMLTGDNPRTVNSIAKPVEVNQVYTELLPENKVEVIRNDTHALVGSPRVIKMNNYSATRHQRQKTP